jgi:hypothetical protein
MSDHEEVKFFWILDEAKAGYEQRRQALVGKGIFYEIEGYWQAALAVGVATVTGGRHSIVVGESPLLGSIVFLARELPLIALTTTTFAHVCLVHRRYRAADAKFVERVRRREWILPFQQR